MEERATSDLSTSEDESPDLNEQLLSAIEVGDLTEVKRLVEVEDVDPNLCTDGDECTTPLHLASEYGHLDIVRYLVEERNCDIECRDKNNDTPLHCAALEGRLDIVQYLISERGCDPMCRDKFLGHTPLHEASQRGHLDIVRFLIEGKKCDMECRDNFEDTPLHFAATGGRLDIVQYLISERGCDPMCRGFSNSTPLHRASRGGHLDIVRYLVDERNCDLECRENRGDTPLHCAALRGALNVVHYLICERGCNPMCSGFLNGTPLHSACFKGHLDIVKYLTEYVKVDPSCRNETDATPLHLASRSGQLPIVKLLVEDYLCDPGVRDKKGMTPADWAEKKSHTHITSYLSFIKGIVSTDLRRTLVAQLKPYARRATPTGKVLGVGTYGSVIELTSARETVAGKVFRMSSTAHALSVALRVCGELSTMMRLNHPNIVVCKGVSLLVTLHLPVLLMERLTTSLHAYLLHPDNSNLSVERKVSILHDTASGLDYLHSQTPAIIHRDLTAKNVLLDSQLRAKIADFGNSRIMDLYPEATPETLTSLPGTLEYMPPEAQGGSVAYDPSLDVFSFGHLSLFTVTQTPVQPLLPPTYYDSSGKLCARSEVKRREKFVEAAEQLLSENHSLLTLFKQCLHNNATQRPRTGELMTKLQRMMTPSPSSSPHRHGREHSPEPPAKRPRTDLGIGDLYDVTVQTRDVAPRWRYIGLALRLRDPDLSSIAAEGKPVMDCLTDMLRLWLNKNYDVDKYGEPSWEMLAEAVREPAGGNNPALADRIHMT